MISLAFWGALLQEVAICQAMRERQSRVLAEASIDPDARTWLRQNAQDASDSTRWIRDRLDTTTADVVIECNVCGNEAVRLPIWTLATQTMRSRDRLDWDQLRACALHPKDSDESTTPLRTDRREPIAIGG